MNIDSLEIIAKNELDDGDIAIYADWHEGADDALFFYRKLYGFVDAVTTTSNSIASDFLDREKSYLQMGEVRSGSVLNFLFRKKKRKKSESSSQENKKSSDKIDEKAGRFLNKALALLLSALCYSGLMSRDDWKAVAGDFNKILEQEIGRNVADLNGVDEHYILDKARMLCKKMGLLGAEIPMYMLHSGGVQQVSVGQFVNDDYIERILVEEAEFWDVPARLYIKKPDLRGDSRWEVLLNNGERIYVAIQHTEWLRKVHYERLKFFTGSYIDVLLRVVKEASGRFKYFALEVRGGDYE